jgi:hypothetical protein
MAALAVRAAERLVLAHMLAGRDLFDVINPNTAGVAAAMMEVAYGRDSVDEPPGDTMGQLLAPYPREHPVATRIRCGPPKPTGIWAVAEADLGPESLP